MGHVPIKELVQEATQLSTRCWLRAKALREQLDPTSAQLWEDVSRALTGHAFHIASLHNDYHEETPTTVEALASNSHPDPFSAVYRGLTLSEQSSVATIKSFAKTLHIQFHNLVPDGRARSIAFTKLEEAVMWAVKGLTS